jgi:large subunit ribosomal protein L5
MLDNSDEKIETPDEATSEPQITETTDEVTNDTTSVTTEPEGSTEQKPEAPENTQEQEQQQKQEQPITDQKSTTETTQKPEQKTQKDKKDFKTLPIREIKIDKVVVNIGVGEAGDKLIKAEKVLKLLTHCKPVRTISRTTNRDLGIRKLMPIGCKVTLRKDPAEQFLKDAFWVKDNKITGYSFDQEGNFSLGIPDYTDFKDMKYDPEIGIFGMDISVTMKRQGYRITKRKLKRRKIPIRNKITTDEVKNFVKTKFKVEVIE